MGCFHISGQVIGDHFVEKTSRELLEKLLCMAKEKAADENDSDNESSEAQSD